MFVRCDLNVPKDGVITDDTRIRAAIPTLEYLVENGAKVLDLHLTYPERDLATSRGVRIRLIRWPAVPEDRGNAPSPRGDERPPPREGRERRDARRANATRLHRRAPAALARRVSRGRTIATWHARFIHLRDGTRKSSELTQPGAVFSPARAFV